MPNQSNYGIVFPKLFLRVSFCRCMFVPDYADSLCGGGEDSATVATHTS
jgi:hypothetical protein